MALVNGHGLLILTQTNQVVFVCKEETNEKQIVPAVVVRSRLSFYFALARRVFCYCGLFESTSSRVQSNNTILPPRVQYPSCGCVETQEPFLRAERGYSNWGLVTQNIRSKGQRLVVVSQAGMHSSGLSWCLCWKVGADQS